LTTTDTPYNKGILEVNLSILGSGRVIKCFSIESPLWKALGHLNEEEIRSVLYSEKFNQISIQLANGKSASTFFEVAPDKQYVAYDIDRISRLEIKVKNKNRSKIFFNELNSDGLLFSLYNYTIAENFPAFEKGLMIIENDMGHFGRCRLREEHFEIDQLQFEIINEKTLLKQMILKINYKGQELIFKKRDSLFNGNVVVIKK